MDGSNNVPGVVVYERNGDATFARGEGLSVAGEHFAFVCTIGGQVRLGQVFTYRPSPYEGTADEQASPGFDRPLQLFKLQPR